MLSYHLQSSCHYNMPQEIVSNFFFFFTFPDSWCEGAVPGTHERADTCAKACSQIVIFPIKALTASPYSWKLHSLQVGWVVVVVGVCLFQARVFLSTSRCMWLHYFLHTRIIVKVRRRAAAWKKIQSATHVMYGWSAAATAQLSIGYIFFFLKMWACPPVSGSVATPLHRELRHWCPATVTVNTSDLNCIIIVGLPPKIISNVFGVSVSWLITCVCLSPGIDTSMAVSVDRSAANEFPVVDCELLRRQS